MWVRESGEKDLLRPPNIFVFFLEVGERGESFDAGAVCLARPLRHPKTAFSVIRVASALFRSRLIPRAHVTGITTLGIFRAIPFPPLHTPFSWHGTSHQSENGVIPFWIASVGTPVLSPWISPEPFTISMILGKSNHDFR